MNSALAKKAVQDAGTTVDLETEQAAPREARDERAAARAALLARILEDARRDADGYVGRYMAGRGAE
ncbi:MAG: hypothetical protein HY721_01335 [Planctomycetes bacterium]|nr:hypothetical protein [Planctomycetota bacterium]